MPNANGNAVRSSTSAAVHPPAASGLSDAIAPARVSSIQGGRESRGEPLTCEQDGHVGRVDVVVPSWWCAACKSHPQTVLQNRIGR